MMQLSKLENGLTVVTETMPHLKTAAIGVWVNAGTRSESEAEHGISHLLEHMAFKGTTRRSARDIAEAIEAVGGEINAATSIDHTAYYARVLNEDLPLAIDVLSDIVIHSTFDPVELARERHVILQEIGAVMDTPDDLVFDYFQAAAYPDQPIGRTILGEEASITRITPDDLKAYLARHYRGDALVLAAAGGIEHDEVLALAKEKFGNLEKNANGELAPARYLGGDHRQKRRLQEAQIIFGFEAPSRRSDRYFAARMLGTILGDGMASRLFQRVREEEGLCYSISAFHWAFADSGVLGIHSATSKGDVKAASALILDELLRITDGVHEDEIARGRAQIKAGLLMALESPAARAGQLARQIMILGRPLALDELLADLESVTSNDIAEMAKDALASPLTLAAIGPVGNLPDAGSMTKRLRGSMV
ncbi:putative Zn-dependent peptidase [Rhodopseudomonas julia]|uniref:Zn-dependent peptidase n=1 Tax=Rhodopseudomonas julia TaxID=200617 RepID=A0ABU0C4D0_9BRAD|nr:pitrilysin family protein [Rhodopseudomonas julia]MDQ0324819.1 putative Zn-dependent peptidase [Rhodopseudomonas julia]